MMRLLVASNRYNLFLFNVVFGAVSRNLYGVHMGGGGESVPDKMLRSCNEKNVSAEETLLKVSNTAVYSV